MLDLVAIEQALLVLDMGSFRKAASTLGVRPSVVSRRVRGLEDAIGIALFQRQKQGAQPTSAGRRILERGRLIIDDAHLLLREASLSGEARHGELCIGVVSSIASGTSRDILRAFLSAHPGVDLKIVEGSPREHISAVRALKMDATYVVGTPFAPGCEVEPLWSEPIVVALPADHPLAVRGSICWDDLFEQQFIVSRADPGPEIYDYIISHMAALGRRPQIEARPVRREGLMALVGLGRGVSVVGTAEAGVAYPGVVFRPLQAEFLPFSVVWSGLNDNPVLRRFLSLARTLMKTVRATAAPPDRLAVSTASPSRIADLSP